VKRLALFVVAALAVVAATSAAAAAPTLPTVTLALTGTSITVGGSPVSGAVTVQSTNTAKDAEPTLFELNPGVTQADVVANFDKLADPNNIAPYGRIVFDADAPKGTTSAQTVLEPGNYLALDTEANNPHKWPIASFTVAASPAPAALPAARATIKAIEFGFKSPGTLHAGSIVRLQNDGHLVHMIDGIKVKNAAAAKKVMSLLKAGKDSKAQKLATGFAALMGPVSSGGEQQLTLKAQPGVYVLACFMSTQDNREHTQLGMLKQVKIVK
jgi:hypothetical protein